MAASGAMADINRFLCIHEEVRQPVFLYKHCCQYAHVCDASSQIQAMCSLVCVIIS